MKMNICICTFGNKHIKFRVQANDTKGLEATATAMAIAITNRIPDRVEIVPCTTQVTA